MHDDQPCAPLALEPHRLGKGPKRCGFPGATTDTPRAKTLRMVVPELRRDGLNPLPLPRPWDMPRAFHFAPPVCVDTFKIAGQCQGQSSVLEGIVRLRKLPFLFELLHNL